MQLSGFILGFTLPVAILAIGAIWISLATHFNATDSALFAGFAMFMSLAAFCFVITLALVK